MEEEGSKFNRFRIMYNKTIKDSLNLPSKASHANLDKLMGVQSAKNIV